MNRKYADEIAFEESLRDDWSRDMGLREVPLRSRSMLFVGLAVALVGAILFGRIFYLGVTKGEAYAKRAELNLDKVDRTPAPRGQILDRNGKILADNRAVFSARLDVKEFLQNTSLEDETLKEIEKVLGLGEEEVWHRINDKNPDLDLALEPVVLSEDLSQAELLALKEANLPTIEVEESYKRLYPDGPAASPFLGYVGLVTGDELKADPKLTGEDYSGKSGVEAFYNDSLIGTPGIDVELRNAKGQSLGQGEKRQAEIGKPLHLTIDADFQNYFYDRLASGLRSLGRTTGSGLAIDPKTGEILAMVNLPSFDGNIFSDKSKKAERQELLTSPLRPLFNRTIGGVYTPGSTIKPLVGVAALKEGVIDPNRSIFSPGYLDVPNPYNPDKPSRFLDWRYQGYVNLYSALAQSSNVYFYTVGGGAFDIKGLGISRLRDWWGKFGLGSLTGIDLPGEAKGFLPSADWKEKNGRGAWLLGDTYNASIGQGDLLVTPVQLLDYIGAIANGGKLLTPHLNKDAGVSSRADLTYLAPQITEAQKGMRLTVTSGLGTAKLLNDLPFTSAGKTGSAQIENNQAENAFFVGYAPYEDPQIAILVLIERSKEGSLNAVPIAKDVLAWYYEHRIKK